MICINMEMPENCNKCPFHDWEYYVCLTPGNGNQDEDVMNYNTSRHPKCPLMDFNPFYVVEHEGQHNPITKSFEHIKEAETYFNKNLGASPTLYEVSPIEWVDKNGTKHEKYN